ncbi:MAG: BrnT family toxin [Pseudomonadota bacterium]
MPFSLISFTLFFHVDRKEIVTFEEAVTFFYDPLSATFDDPHHSVGERRLITIGLSSTGRLIVVSHTEKGKALRIISARSATAQERKRHEN